MNPIPEALKYTATHEWLEVNQTEARIGITDHAQHLLGDLVYIDLPKIGQTFNRGDALGVLESVKAASDYYAPISGEVIAVNEEIIKRPELLNQDPYGLGWLVKLSVRSIEDTEQLLSATQYKASIAGDQ